MKRFFIIFVITLLAAASYATDSTWTFAGVRADFKPGPVVKVTTGRAMPLGNNIWFIPSAELGAVDTSLGTTGSRTGALNADFSWCPISGNLGAVHILLGGDADWVEISKTANVASYASAAVGAIGVLNLHAVIHPRTGPIGWFTDRFSVWAAWKYTANISDLLAKTDSRFPAGNRIGLGLAWKGSLF